MSGAEPRWTQTDINELRIAALSGHMAAAISHALRRSEADVVRMAARLRVKLVAKASAAELLVPGEDDEQGTVPRQSRGPKTEKDRAQAKCIESFDQERATVSR